MSFWEHPPGRLSVGAGQQHGPQSTAWAPVTSAGGPGSRLTRASSQDTAPSEETRGRRFNPSWVHGFLGGPKKAP